MNRLFSAAIIAFLLCAPAWSQKRVEEIVARVNSDIILKSDLDRELEMRAANLRDRGLDPARLQQELAVMSKDALRDLIDRSLLVQVAKEAGLSAESEVLKTMEELRQDRGHATAEALEKEIIEQFGDLEEFKNDIRARYLTDQVISHEVYGRIIITNEEMRTYYEANKQQFDRPAGIRLSHVVVLYDSRLPDQAATQKKKIEEAFAAIKRGDDFEEVARKYSEVTSSTAGGDIGFFGEGEIDAEIEKAVANLPKGQVTEILTRPDAYEIYKVTDKHAGGILSFELAQQYIWQELMGDVAPPRVREYLTKLRKDGFVEIRQGYVDTGAAPAKVESATAQP